MVRNYWTQERMRNAIPINLNIPKDMARDLKWSSKFPDKKIPRAVLSEPIPMDMDKSQKNFTALLLGDSKVNGKIFYRKPGIDGDFQCSGAAINSGSKRLIATAAHCVHGNPNDGGTWHQNWHFVPDYHLGWGEYGSFPAFMFWALPGWVNYGLSPAGLNADVAFVVTDVNLLGQRVVDAVGGYGLAYGGGYEFDATIFGYPVNIENGLVQQGCANATEPVSFGWYTFISVGGCNFGSGASGDPWLGSYNNYMGVGFLRGITSWSVEDDFEYSNSPYFSSVVSNIFYSANSVDW